MLDCGIVLHFTHKGEQPYPTIDVLTPLACWLDLSDRLTRMHHKLHISP